jgi:chitinase
MKKSLLHTPLYTHLKNSHRIKFVADIYRMMHRWGMANELDVDMEVNRLQLKMFTIELGDDIVVVDQDQ